MTTTEQEPRLGSSEAKLIGQRLRGIAKTEGLDFATIASRTEGALSESTVRSIMYGRYNAGIRQVMKLINALGYDMVFIKRIGTPLR